MTPQQPQVVVLSFHGGDLAGGGQVFRLSTPGGTRFVVTAPRGRVPDLDGAFVDPSPAGIEQVLRRNDQLQWLRVERDGQPTWHPLESEARLALSDSAWVVCYGTRQVPAWLRELAGHTHAELLLRMGAAAGLDVSAVAFTQESILQAGPSDGSAWTPGRHLGTGLQGLWSWSTASWSRAAWATALFAVALWLFGATVTAFSPDPLVEAPHVEGGVGLPGSGLPPLELDPCQVLAGSGRPSTAAFCAQVVAVGSVDPDLWYIAGNTTREIRADAQALHALSDRTEEDVHNAWSPVLAALFGKLLLVEFMPPEWGVDLVQPDSPYLGPTRPMDLEAEVFAERFPALLAEGPRWQALWTDVADPPDPASLHAELFGRSRTLAAHGELMVAARR